MSNRAMLEKKIEAAEKEIESLRSDIVRKESFLQGLREALKFMPREGGEVQQPQELRANSDMAKARDLLRSTGHPLHIDDILKGLDKEINKMNRASVAGSIATYARKGQIFTKTAPATFGLADYGQKQKSEDHSVSFKAESVNGREGYLV